jgi:hypothetical protein
MEPMDLLNFYIGLNPLGKALQEGLDYYTSETIKPEVKKDSVDTAPATTSVSTSAGNEPKKQDLPTGGVSGGDITALLGALIQAQKEEAAQAREYYPQKAAIDLETYKQQLQLAEAAGLEKMREKTSRDIELQTIAAWQGVTQAQIQRDAAMGLGMMNLAYQSGMPNSALLQSAAQLATAGGQGFGTPASVLK